MKIIGLVLSFVIAVVSIFEGTLLILDQTSANSDALSKSLYLRNFYLSEAEKFIEAGDFKKALIVLDKHIDLNPLDAQALHLTSVIYCNKNYEKHDAKVCAFYAGKAIELNPKNDLSYYVDYFRALTKKSDVNEVMDQALEFLKIYFEYVEKNVHFTAYTPNVEAAAELVDILSKGFGLDKKLIYELRFKKEKMLETAKKLRAEKTF